MPTYEEPTYEELFNQLESELDLAIENNQPFEICVKISETVNLYLEFAFLLMSARNYSEAVENFNSAGENAIMFNKQYQEIIDNKTFPDNSDELKKLKELFEENENYLLSAIAYSQLNSALVNNTNRNPGLAASDFEEAEKGFNNLADKTEPIANTILANYCHALKFYSQALEDFFRASFSNAKTKCQQAMVLLEKIIQKDIEPLKEKEEYKDFYSLSINRFRSDYQVIKSYYFISDAKYQFNNRNFKNAAKQFSKVVSEFDLSIKNYMNSPENESLKTITSAEYHNYLGWKYLSEAEACRESGDWNNAFNNYDLVKKQWEEASSLYLQSDFPGASALQESLLNASLTVDVYQAVCENQKESKEKIAALELEINGLKDKLFNVIKPMGVTINNTQDVVNTVEQNAQFVQNIENNARQGIEEFLEILKSSRLDESLKKKIEANGAEVLQSKEKGPKFLEKVKNFTKDVAEVIKNVGDIATPLIPAFKYLSLLI
jgi:hypothetical protein